MRRIVPSTPNITGRDFLEKSHFLLLKIAFSKLDEDNSNSVSNTIDCNNCEELRSKRSIIENQRSALSPVISPEENVLYEETAEQFLILTISLVIFFFNRFGDKTKKEILR